jgi:hypothetical protein
MGSAGISGGTLPPAAGVSGGCAFRPPTTLGWRAVVTARTVWPAMPDDDGLESLSSQELHDRAVSRAKRHLDVRFFWDLMRLLPAAEAGAGELDQAETDVMRLSAHADDITDAGRGEVGDLLRPFYIDYLRRHGVSAR